MVDYRKLVRDNVVFSTAKGTLIPQDLWRLKVSDLRVIAKDLYAQIKDIANDDAIFGDLGIEDTNLVSYLTKEQELLTLKFEVVKDVLITKVEEERAKVTAKARRQQLEQLQTLLHQKQNEELANKSVEELQAMIKQLQS